MIYSIIITSILFGISIIFNKSKTIYYINFVWMWLQLSFCTDINRVDYQNYVRNFFDTKINGITIKNSEFGYTVLNYIFSLFTNNFAIMAAGLALISLLLIAISIPKYTDKIAIISALYMWYPLYNNGIQIRWFLASSIVIYSFQYIIKDNKKNNLCFIFLCLLAMTIHTLSIFMLIFLIVPNVSTKNMAKITIIFSMSLFIIMKIFTPLMKTLVGASRYETKISHSNGIMVVILAGVWQFGMLAIMLLIEKRRANITSKFDIVVLNSTILSLFCLPLYAIDFSFERIVRCLFVFQIIYIINGIIQVDSESKITYTILFSLYYIFTFVYFILLYHDGFTIKFKVYTDNNDIIKNPQDYIILLFMLVWSTILILLYETYNKYTLKKHNELD